MSYATFDGTGSNYFTRTALPATTAYPFFVISDEQLYERADYGTVYCSWCSERAAGDHGTVGYVFEGVPFAHADDGTTNGDAKSVEASLQKPYVDKVLRMYVSATERRVYINGVLEATDTTNVSINLSTGSPVTRIGLRAAAGQGWRGALANVAFGTGTPTAGDIALLSVPGVNYQTVSLAGGTMTNWYELNGNGNDTIGGANMSTVGTVPYVFGTLASPDPPTRNQIIQWALMQPDLPADMPTIMTGQTPPASLGIDGTWTNFAGCDYYDIAFTGNCGAWNSRAYLIRCTTPIIPGRSLVFQDGGHAVQSEWPSPYRDSAVIKAVNNAGHDVIVTQLPLEGPTDPGYTGSAQLHDTFWALFTANVANALERWYRENVALVNAMVGTYQNISTIGLSGGGERGVIYAAIDPRINHAVVCVRGTLPHRRMLGSFDFEQRTYALGYKYEEFYRLCAQGNRRLWIVCHPTDDCCFAQFVNISGGPGGAYLSASSLDTNFLAPIRAQEPYSDVQFFEDQGSNVHSWTDWTINNVVLPALSTGLSTVYYADKLLGGTAYRPKVFTRSGAPAWYADMLYNAPGSSGVAVTLTGVQGTGAVGAFDIPQNIGLTGVQGTGSVGTFGKIISSNVTLDSLRGIGRIGNFVGLGPKGGVPGSGLGVKLGLGL